MNRIVPVLVLACVLAVAACAGGAGGSPSPVPTPTLGPVTSAEDAFARIVAFEPRLAGTRPVEPDSIGQASWYEATEADDGYAVEVYVGWGDCMAGCIGHHSWRFAVAADGTVELLEDEGDAVPPGEWPSPGGTGRTGIFGTASAGPTCPVEQPGDPACEPRAVAGATILVRDATGAEVESALTGPDGTFFVELPAGSYTIAAQPVEGLMGFPEPVPVEVTDGEATVELPYDTGIR
jgi:hypothetical protein